MSAVTTMRGTACYWTTGSLLELKDKYGKNAVLRGTNLMEAGTQRERNNMIGGHRAGYDSTGKS